MKKNLNNKGFALVETLVGAMFVSVVFIIIFENYFPLMAKYKRYEHYDDLDSKYIIGHLRNIIYNDSNRGNIYDQITSVNLDESTCDNNNDPVTPSTVLIADLTSNLCSSLYDASNKATCSAYLQKANISKVYLIHYDTSCIKKYLSSISGISRSLELYIEYLPTFTATANYDGAYKKRLVIEIEHKDTTVDDNSKYYTYANIEFQE